MNWIFDNFQLVIVAVIVVAYLVRALKNRPRADDAEPPDGAPPRQTITIDEAERTRRIQEEIRRKILARQHGSPPPLASPGDVVVLNEDRETEEPEAVEEPEYTEEGPRPRPPPLRQPFPQSAPAPVAQPMFDAGAAAMLERQRMLEEQLRLLAATRAIGVAGVSPLGMPAQISARDPAQRRELRRALRRDLSGHQNLRRAILLREVLGPPPGLERDLRKLPRR